METQNQFIVVTLCTQCTEQCLCFDTVFFRLVVQGPREIGVSYCVHNVTTAVLPSTSSMEILSSGHIMYTIGHTYIPKSWTTNLKNTVAPWKWFLGQ